MCERVDCNPNSLSLSLSLSLLSVRTRSCLYCNANWLSFSLYAVGQLDGVRELWASWTVCVCVLQCRSQPEQAFHPRRRRKSQPMPKKRAVRRRLTNPVRRRLTNWRRWLRCHKARRLTIVCASRSNSEKNCMYSATYRMSCDRAAGTAATGTRTTQ